MLTEKNKEMLQSCIENEGFDYAFLYYSEFKEIKDKKFHELRKAYVDAAKKLTEYIEVEAG